MKPLHYSFIIPVYNRPNEIDELLESFTKLEGDYKYEIVIVEDGSIHTSEEIIANYTDELKITYFFKENSGPGDSRNYGMQRAEGNYFIILDSDVILPPNYLVEVNSFLINSYYHCFGGPDTAHESFTNLQKAINFSMTSFITTGGVRGGKNALKDFEPRSFNLGLSKEAFIATKGFGKIHPGEDPDLVLRLRQLGYRTTLIPKAYVYHKRRISWKKFYQQVNKFGQVRPILNLWHPSSRKVTFWFPLVFSLGLIMSLFFAWTISYIPICFYALYFIAVLLNAILSSKSLKIAIMSLFAVLVQFFGYGFGFLKTVLKLQMTNKSPQEIFPKLFFK